MKNIKFIAAAFFIVLLAVCTFTACNGSSSVFTESETSTQIDFTYVLHEGTWAISDYTGTAAQVIVPSSHEGIPVTAIEDEAFSSDKTITSVFIPDSVTTIGNFAFHNCSNLAKVDMGNGVTDIGEYAFARCGSLSEIKIPEGIATIGNNAFLGSDNIISASIPIDVIDLVPHDNMQAVEITGNGIVPESAFEGCTTLTSVTVGAGITSIGYHAFYDCENLTEVNNNSGIQLLAESTMQGYIAYYAESVNSKFVFTYAYGTVTLTGYNGTDEHLVLPAVYTSLSGDITAEYAIGDSVFREGNMLSVTIPDSVISIGEDAFYSCINLTNVDLGRNITAIENYAFRNCNKLKSVIVPDSVTHLGSGVFSGCNSLESITVPFVGAEADKTDSDTYQYPFGYIFGTSLFAEAVEVRQSYYGSSTSSTTSTTYYIPSSLRSVTVTGGNILCGAFYNCSTLTSVTIGGNVAGIGDQAFYYCRRLTSITIPDSVTSIGDSAFYYCDSLMYATIGNGVTSIGNDVFSDCSVLESIVVQEGNETYHSDENCLIETASRTLLAGCKNSVIPSDGSVASIGGSAFRGCSGLTSVTIPDSVTSIGDDAFYGCSSLTSITIPDGVTSIGGSAFRGCSDLTSVTIMSGVTEIGEYAFSFCTGLTSVTIPDSVTGIGLGIFSDCSSLKSITVPFVGAEAGKTSSDTYQYPFGYIFGTSTSTGGMKVTQSYYGYNTSSTTSETYYIPASLRNVTVTGGNILFGAFCNCSMLTSITIPDSVTSIGGSAFRGCSGLTSVTIPDSVTSIGSFAFNGCTELATVYNYSGLNIVAGSAENGYVAYYADNVYTDPPAETDPGTEQPDEPERPGEGEVASDYTFSYDGESAVLTGYTGTATDLILPDSFVAENGELVTEYFIGNSAFENCTSLTSVIISDSVVGIGERAFANCEMLNSIIISVGLTNISPTAFNGCHSVANVSIPAAAIPYIPKSNLTTVIITGGDFIPSNAFLNCENITEVVIDDAIMSIGASAFDGCTSIVKATVPALAISLIPHTSLKELIITSGESIQAGAFELNGLEKVSIPSSITYIGEGAFYASSNALDVYVEDLAAWCNIAFADYDANPLSTGGKLYVGEQQVTDLVIPGEVTAISPYAFVEGMFSSIYISESVAYIGDWAFSGCSQLAYISFGNDVDSIGRYAFQNCENLTNVTLPDSIITIGDNAFVGCSNLTCVTIGAGVKEIGVGAFSNVPKLEEISVVEQNTQFRSSVGILYNKNSTELIRYAPGKRQMTYFIPDGVTHIAEYAFEGCTELTDIFVPESITSIDQEAFAGCESLRWIALPEALESINAFAFADCNKMTNIDLPDSLTYIGNNAFDGCAALLTVSFAGTIAAWEAITKGQNWKSSCPFTEIQCSDGTVSV